GADCEDDAKSLARELSGDGRADADRAFRVRRVDIYPSWTDGGAFVGGIPYGPPLVRNFSSPGQQTSRSPRRAIGYARILSQVGQVIQRVPPPRRGNGPGPGDGRCPARERLLEPRR